MRPLSEPIRWKAFWYQRRVAILAERQAGLRLDHGKRGTQLVRRVGGELELPLPGKLDRRADPASDDQAAEEDEEQHPESGAPSP